jgi:hypothetical protein
VLTGRHVLSRVRNRVVSRVEFDAMVAKVRLDSMEAVHIQLLSER